MTLILKPRKDNFPMPDYMPPPAALPPGSMVWAYLRDSGGEAQEQSVPQQKAEIQTYCQRHNLLLGRIFADIAKSGGSVIGRDAFNDLVDMVKDADLRPRGLLLWNFARFARELDDSSYYKALIRKQGVVIHSLTDPIPDGTYGRVVEVIIDITNEEKRRQTSRDVKRALAATVRRGYASGGFPPRGYKAEEVVIGTKRDGSPRTVSRWVPDPENWDLVVLAWKLRSQGKSYGEIQEATHGLLYNSKSCWPSFFANKTYLGVGKCGDLEILDHHPAAVDQATWDAVQKIQAAHPKRGKTSHPAHPRRLASPSLFSGLAVCMECGSALFYSRSNTQAGRNFTWPYYMCGKKTRYGWDSCEGRMINAARAESSILDTVLNRILTPDFIQNLLAETKAQLADTSAIERDIERLEKQVKETQKAIQNLLDLAETYGAQAAGARLHAREAELAVYQAEIRELQSKKAAAQVEISPEALSLALAVWRGQIETASQSGDIRVLRSLLFPRFITKIELGYDRARLWYSFPLDTLAPGGIRDAVATGSILTTFMIEGKKTRQRLKSEPKGPSERDMHIYELHKAGKTAREVAEQFGLSEQSVWGICRKIRNFQLRPDKSEP